MVSGSLSLLCSRCFSPFPHGTGSLSVSHEYLALRDGPRCFTQNSSCSALLRILPGWEGLRIRDCHSLWCSFPIASPRLSSCQYGSPTTPMRPEPHWFGLLRVRSPLLAQSFVYFLFLRVLRCFSSPGSPPYIHMDDSPSDCRVVPFGNPRIKGHLRLPAAYRSLSRPSSPVRA